MLSGISPWGHGRDKGEVEAGRMLLVGENM